jgi:curli biogenesis system outer membrane secretion channel CsgG
MKKALATLALAATLAVGGTVMTATQALPAQKAQAYGVTGCHTDLTGVTWCYQFGCSWFEMVAMGCYDHWYATNRWYA